MKKEKKLPLLLVIGNPEENWYDLCAEYKNKFKVEQAMWNEIGLISYSDQKGVTLTLAPSSRPNCELQKTYREKITPDLIIIRMFSRYIGTRLGHTPDYRNILYGFYHANTPMINGFEAAMAELEKPVMYGRLKAIQDKVGNDVFPLIPQNYYPEYMQIQFPPPEPFVLKVGFPHAGFGKIRINNRDELEDIKSIIALNNNYAAAEPLIDSDYELRIVFIAPNYYRVNKRRSMNWKVNFGMANERVEIKMEPRWKKWIDLIYDAYPDMLTFDIDAIVDKNGKEYILEINGSAQGFSPEHGDHDLEHMKRLCIYKLEEVTGIEIVPYCEEKDLLKNHKVREIANVSLEDKEKETTIINLRNEVEDLKKVIRNKQKNIEMYYTKEKNKKNSSNSNSMQIIIAGVIGTLLALIIGFIFNKFKILS